jgi:hypothetical protein
MYALGGAASRAGEDSGRGSDEAVQPQTAAPKITRHKDMNDPEGNERTEGRLHGPTLVVRRLFPSHLAGQLNQA